MRIIHVNSDDLAGGAARAANRLHAGLLAIGEDSRLLVQRRRSDSPEVHGPQREVENVLRQRVRQGLDRLPLRLLHGSVKTAWTNGWMPNPGLRGSLRKLQPDLVILHWGGSGFIPASLLEQLDCPVFWVLHDMAPFTGGCHYDRGCGRFRSGCGSCPILESDNPRDISARNLQRKLRHMQTKPEAIIAPSQWIARLARESLLFRNHRVARIHHPHDLEQFKPVPKALAREILGWDPHRDIVLFGAVHGGGDRRKGFDLLTAALEQPGLRNRPNSELRVFGASRGPEMSSTLPVHYAGTISDDVHMSLLYSAADVVVVPSRQEAFGLTGSEAHCCGTPVVGFNRTGLADIVDHKRTGYLADPDSAEDLARGIAWVLGGDGRREQLARHARYRAERLFEHRQQAGAYLKLYQSVVGSAGRSGETPDPAVTPAHLPAAAHT